MTHHDSHFCEQPLLKARVRAHLEQVARQRMPITYQELAKALQLRPPNTIHQLTVALECLMEEDAGAGRPLIGVLVISKARGGLPALGFLDCARRLGRFDGDPFGAEARTFYAAEFDAAVAFWGAAVETIGAG